MNTGTCRASRPAAGLHAFLSSSAHPQGPGDFAGLSPTATPGLLSPTGWAQQLPHLHCREIRPLSRARLIHWPLWFIISLTLNVLSFSALFGLWLLLGSLSYWTFIPFQETLFFFSSLSRLINNCESTSLDRSASCLLQRTAGASLWGSLWAYEGHITCH